MKLVRLNRCIATFWMSKIHRPSILHYFMWRGSYRAHWSRGASQTKFPILERTVFSESYFHMDYPTKIESGPLYNKEIWNLSVALRPALRTTIYDLVFMKFHVQGWHSPRHVKVGFIAIQKVEVRPMGVSEIPASIIVRGLKIVVPSAKSTHANWFFFREISQYFMSEFKH